MQIEEIKDQICDVCHKMWQLGWVAANDGNVSVRLEDGTFLATPTGMSKSFITPDKLLRIDAKGNVLEGAEGLRPSSEIKMHLRCYEKRADVNAVVHAHPPAATGFAVAHRPMDMYNMIEDVAAIGAVPLTPYGTPSTTEVPDAIEPYLNDHDVMLLENHGVCIGAPDMFTAFQRFETLNYTATLEVLASKLGKIHSLPENAYHMSETNAHTKLDDFIPRSHTSEELAARRDMITLIHRSYKMGLFTATHGTYSVRLSDGSFLITPFGFDRAYLEEDDLVRVKGGMKELCKTPSRAVLLHQKIYEQHPDVGAILLAHPVHAMAFAVTDAAFDARTIPESYILLRDVKTLPYEEIYREPDKMAAEFDVSHPVAIVENDCVIVTGNSLLQAFDRLEVMELTANSILDSQSLGSIVHISEAEIAELKTAFHLEG